MRARVIRVHDDDGSNGSGGGGGGDSNRSEEISPVWSSSSIGHAYKCEMHIYVHTYSIVHLFFCSIVSSSLLPHTLIDKPDI